MVYDIDVCCMFDLFVCVKCVGVVIWFVQFGQVQGLFDLVVVDVFCLGSGIW